MKAYVVETILLAFLEDTHPLVLIGRRKACLWKTAVLHRATKEERTVIDIELTPLCLYLAQAELRLIDCLASFNRQAIQIRMELIPVFHVTSQVELELDVTALCNDCRAAHHLTHLSVVHVLDIGRHVIVVDGEEAQAVHMILQLYLHGDGTLLNMRGHTHAPDIQLLPLCLQFDTSSDTVPVALCLVSHGMRVLSHTHILNSIIHTDSYLVALTLSDIFRHIIAMGYGKRHLMAHLATVDKDRRLYMRTLQEERDTLVVPFLGNIHIASVPCITHIMFLGCQEEGELHLSLPSVGFHIRVIEIRRVIKRARPLRVDIHLMPLVICEQRARQHHVVIVMCGITKGKVPGTLQIHHHLSLHTSHTQQHGERRKNQFFSHSITCPTCSAICCIPFTDGCPAFLTIPCNSMHFTP